MMLTPNCPLCRKPLSPDETVESVGYTMVHVDCGRPRSLSPEEYVFLYVYCWDHTIAECGRCAQKFRQDQFGSGPFSVSAYLCLRCQSDLTDSVRAHLLACSMLPEDLRRRVREARETTQRLLKQSQTLSDRVEVLRREREAALAELNVTRQRARHRHSTSDLP